MALEGGGGGAILRYHDARSFFGNILLLCFHAHIIKFNRKKSHKEFVYIYRDIPSKNQNVYIFYLSEAFFFTQKATKAFFQKKYIHNHGFLLEIYKKHIDYLGNILLKSIGDL